jgi:hypothetical protein
MAGTNRKIKSTDGLAAVGRQRPGDSPAFARAGAPGDPKHRDLQHLHLSRYPHHHRRQCRSDRRHHADRNIYPCVVGGRRAVDDATGRRHCGFVCRRGFSLLPRVLCRPSTSCRSRSEIFSSSGRLSPGPSTLSCCGALPFRWALSLCSRCCRQSGSHYASRSAPGSFCTANTSYGRPKRWQPSSTSASFPRWLQPGPGRAFNSWRRGQGQS